MLRIRAALLLALVTLTPFALAAYGDLDASDAAGDESTMIGPVGTTGTCRAPASDILGYRLRVVGDDLVASMDLGDAFAPMTCGDATLGPLNGGYWVVELSPTFPATNSTTNVTTNVDYAMAYVRLLGSAQAEACAYVRGLDGHDSSACARTSLSALVAGATWSWSIPLDGPLGNATYDLRGYAYDVYAWTTNSYGPTSHGIGTARDAVPVADHAL